MSFSLYDAVVPQFIQIAGAVRGMIDTAEAKCTDCGVTEGDLVRARLADDMLPFCWQVKWVASHSIGAIEAARAGQSTPDQTQPPTSFAELRAIIDDCLDALKALDPDEVNGLMGRDVVFSVGEMRLPFKAEDYLLSFAQPNFYFHATTAYGILRNKGIPVGKRDFLGAMRLNLPA